MGEKDKKSQQVEGAFGNEKGKISSADQGGVPSVIDGSAVSQVATVSVNPAYWEGEAVGMIQSLTGEIRFLWRKMGNLPDAHKRAAKKDFLNKLSEIMRGVEALKGSSRLTPYSVKNILGEIERRFSVLVEGGDEEGYKNLDLVCALERVDFDFLERQMVNLETVLDQAQIRGAVAGVMTQANRSVAIGGGEEWKLKQEFPYASADEFWAIQEARKLFGESDMNSQMRGLKLLEERGLVAHVAFDRIHQSGSHQFSGRGLDEPNPFAIRFADQTGVGPKSVVLDTGCGMGHDSVHFAKRGAKVIALDTSRFALDQFRKNLALVHPEFLSRITMLCEDTRRALSSMMGSEKVTHIYGYSSWHYDPPMVLKSKLKYAYSILDRNREKGYLGLAVKTIESDSAKIERHYRLTKGDDLNFSMDKEDRILRLYPEEDMVPELVQEAGFTPILLDIENAEGYDKPGETEVFRLVIAKVPGAPHRRRRR